MSNKNVTTVIDRSGRVTRTVGGKEVHVSEAERLTILKENGVSQLASPRNQRSMTNLRETGTLTPANAAAYQRVADRQADSRYTYEAFYESVGKSMAPQSGVPISARMRATPTPATSKATPATPTTPADDKYTYAAFRESLKHS